MKRLLPIGFLLALCSLSVLAGGYFMNDTGETVYGLRVEFSEPVIITSFGDMLTTIDPQGESTTFTFSGGAVEPWGDHWIIWEPGSASVVSEEWLSTDRRQPADASAEDFDYEVMLEEISSVITVSRHIDRNCVPFSVRYEITNPESLNGYAIIWDTDKYVDTDGNGNPQDDRDHEGSSIELTYLENYNPTITLLIRDRADDPIAQWENMVRNDFTIGTPILLNGGLLLPAGSTTPDSAEWSQLHMQQMSLEYMTEYESSISQASQLVAEATHHEPGRYVYQLEVRLESRAQTRTTVAAWVPPTTNQRKTCGFTMADLWNEYYDEGSQSRINLAMFFSDQHAVDKLGFLEGQGFSDILVHNFFPIVEAYPLPRISFTGGHFLGDEDMAFVFSQIERGGVQWGSYYFGEDATIDGGSYWSYSSERTRDYISHYFEQYAGLAAEKAAHAEEIGLSSFAFAMDPYLWGLDGIAHRSSGDARWVWQQWLGIYESVGAVFSGDLGMVPLNSFCSVCTPLDGTLDYIFHFLWTEKAARYFPSAGSIHDLRAGYARYLQAEVEPLARAYKLPIRYMISAFSYEDSRFTGYSGRFEQDCYDAWRHTYAWSDVSSQMLSGGIGPADYTPSFLEQVVIMEAILPELATATYVEAIYSRHDYWKLLDYSEFRPTNPVDFYGLYHSSLQGKPAFDVYKMWASALDPNDRLLYRRVPGVEDFRLVDWSLESSTHVADLNWESSYRICEFDQPLELATYWRDYERPIATSVGWGMPGSDVASVAMQPHEGGLAFQWELRDSGAGWSPYDYTIQLNSDDEREIRLYLTVSPLDGWVRASMITPAGHRNVDITIDSLLIDDDTLAFSLPNQTLPLSVELEELLDWSINVMLNYRDDEISEAYNLARVDAYLVGTGEDPLDHLSEILPTTWGEAPILVQLASDYQPQEFWLNGPVPIEESEHWDLPGHSVAAVRMQLDCEVLGVLWELHEAEVRETPFVYSLHFYPPESNRTTLFLDARPRDDSVQLKMRIADEWYSLPTRGIGHEFGDNSLEILVPDIELPNGETINDLGDWTIEAYVVFPNSSGGEYYSLIKGIRFNRLGGQVSDCLGD